MVLLLETMLAFPDKEVLWVELITAHRLWSDWPGSGRVRKFAMVAKQQ